MTSSSSIKETRLIDSQGDPFVYKWPGRTGFSYALWLFILVAFLAASGYGLILLYNYVRAHPFQDSRNLLNILQFAGFILYISAISVLIRLFNWRSGSYSVSMNEYGLRVEGSHSLHGKLIGWQDIDRTKKAYFSTGLKISTFGEPVKLFIPCDSGRLPMLLSFMAKYLNAKQPNRSYPRRFNNQYRYIKLALSVVFTGFMLLVAYAYQNLVYLLSLLAIVIYWLADGLFVQKIELTAKDITSSTFWSTKHFLFSEIKQLRIVPSHLRSGLITLIILITVDHPKPVELDTRGIDPVNLFLAIHNAWKKATLSANP